jgi:MOSC domain-containing protein YiiM
MKLISIQVGHPREATWRGVQITTSIFKEPVDGPIMARTLNLDGDRQADLSVHGGVTKAVYAYPSEHYEYWRSQLPDVEFPFGQFGENFTTEGLFEDDVYIGDRFRIGNAEFVVTEPRMPCSKLVVKFQRPDIAKRFLQSRRSGFYFSVVREGEVRAGDQIEKLTVESSDVSVADIVRLYAFEKDDVDTLRRVARLEALPDSWRRHFNERLEGL